MRRQSFTWVVGIALAFASTTQAITVFVSSTVAAWSGSGTITDPYGSIQEAYASLWGTSGDHSILLLPGTYTGDNIGKNTWGNGLIDFNDGGGGPGGVIPPYYAGSRAANTFTLQGVGSVVLDRNTTNGQNELYTGRNPRGLFSVGVAEMRNMIVQNIEIRLTAAGASLVGKRWGGVAGHELEITFRDVDLYLTGERTGVYVVDSDTDSTRDIVFDQSNIYWDPADFDTNGGLFGRIGTAWPEYGGFVWYAPIIDGNNSSRIWTYDGIGGRFDPDAYDIQSDLTRLWAGSRNPDVNGAYATNGVVSVGTNPDGVYFVNYFLTTLPADDDDDNVAGGVPETSTVVLLALGAAVIATRRRSQPTTPGYRPARVSGSNPE